MADAIRVAHLTPTYFSPESVVGGGERYVFNLASALQTADSRGRFGQAIFALGATDGFFAHDGIPVRVLRNDSPSANAMDGLSMQLWRELATFDLIHAHQCLTMFGAHACVLARSLGKTLVVTDLGGGENRVMTAGKGLGLADGAVSISRYAHSLIAGDFPGPAEILVGPIDTDAFSAAETPYAGAPLALCVSRILPHKGIDRVIRALPPGLRLRVVGRVYDAPYAGLLLELARGKDVEFIHDADDARLRRLYREASVFVQASTMKDCYGRIVGKPELMGLTPLEAMASGLPAIVSDVASFPEIAGDSVFARTFKDDAALCAALREVASGGWPSRDAGGRARRYVMDRYGYRSVGERLGSFYARLHTAAARRAA